MSSDPLARARTLPSGAVFHRCALQVNPQSYGSRFRGWEPGGDACAHASAVIQKAVEINVSVLAVTDHNDVSGVPAFQDAAKGYGIHVFPGFELSSSDGVHVLCIYPENTDSEQLGRFLGEFGIRQTEPSADPSTKNLVEILRQVQEQRGITVAAHVTHEHGLLKVLSGNTRIRVWRGDDLLAIQIPGSVDDLPSEYRSIVKNKDAPHRRTHAADDQLAVAVVNAKDVATPEQLADPSATCWIKMSEVSIEGLRQAFLDPGSRIRLNSEPSPEEHAELVALAWEGGFLDGAAIHFNQNLNVLIGGRGAGKSTVIESLRYVLGLEPTGEEALKAHQEIVRHVLRSGTKISLLVHSYRPSRTKREYRIERVNPNPPVVRDENGQVSNLRPEQVIPSVELYGQHEIAELTQSPEKLTRLLDRFVDRDESLDRRKADIRQHLGKMRRSMLEVQAEVEETEERLAALPALEETLKRFQEAGLEDRLRERSLLVREEQVLESIPDRLRTFHECLENIRQELPIDRLFLSPKALEDLPGKEILAGANEPLDRLSRDLNEVAKRLDAALERAENAIGEVRAGWGKRKDKVQTAYQKILRDLQKSAVDGEEFIRLCHQIESLRPLRERQALLKRVEKEHKERRRSLLDEWENIKAEEFRLLDRAARRVGKKLRDRVQVEVTATGNREPLFDVFKSAIGGRLSEAVQALRAVKDFSLPRLVTCCRMGVTEVLKHYRDIPQAQAGRLANASAETLMKIEELELPPTTAISLNTAPVNEPPLWQALKDLSKGQKATAVLLLLLLESDAPLLVDQPEDDLDNRFITDGVVPRMRDEKRRRQFVFSTHNANVPVIGDAELILGLAAAGEAEEGKARIRPEHMGSIDTPSVRVLVEEILEGGKDAFERRRRKYGF